MKFHVAPDDEPDISIESLYPPGTTIVRPNEAIWASLHPGDRIRPRQAINGTCCACGYAGDDEMIPCPRREEHLHCGHWSRRCDQIELTPRSGE